MSVEIELSKGPKVYLIGRQVVDDLALDAFLADEGVEHWTTDTEVGGAKLAEVGGRLCYMSFARPRPGGHDAYIRNIRESGHGSVLEHAVFTLIITGISRSLTHELVRHRAGFAFSQLSQRFVDESRGLYVVHPSLEPLQYAYEVAAQFPDEDLTDDQKEDAAVWSEWLMALERCQETYRRVADHLAARFRDIPDKTLRRKRAREAAREILPNATETKIQVTVNARAARHLIEMRASGEADAQIARVVRRMHAVLAKAAPSLFGDYTPGHGGALHTPTRKV